MDLNDTKNNNNLPFLLHLYQFFMLKKNLIFVSCEENSGSVEKHIYMYYPIIKINWSLPYY